MPFMPHTKLYGGGLAVVHVQGLNQFNIIGLFADLIKYGKSQGTCMAEFATPKLNLL